MYRNYFKTAFRAIVKNKIYTTINTLGLAVGIGCFLLIAAYLYNEFSYDRFHTKADRICRIKMLYRYGDGGLTDIAVTPTAAVPSFKRAFPEITAGIRLKITNGPVPVQYGDNIFNEKKLMYADADFFTLFSFPLLQGNPASALNDPNSIVITASAAKKYFGTANAIGKTLKVNNQRDMLITGIAADVPGNSQIKFDFVAAFSSLDAFKTEEWGSANYFSYILLRDKKDIPVVQRKIDAYIKQAFADEIKIGGYTRFELEPLKRVHLYTTATDNPEPTGNGTSVYILGVVGILLLLIACINFMNLATARSSERAQEIGVRKTIGAAKGQLFWQFITESSVITFIAVVLGVLLSYLALPFFNQLTERSLHLNFNGNTSWLIILLFSLFIVITFLAGTYPALFLSAFQPLKVLKKKSSSTKAGGLVLRKSLIVFQFVVSSFFIVCTIVVVKQRSYIQHKDLGLDRSFVMTMDVNGKLRNNLNAFKNNLLANTAIRSVSASYNSPINNGSGYILNKADGKPSGFTMNVAALPIEKDFVTAMGMHLVAGADLTDADILQVQPPEGDLPFDKRYYHFILNETAVKALGWKAGEAIGKKISMNGRSGEIKAVVKDFNFVSMHQPIAPIILFPEYTYFSKLLVKVSGNNIKTAAAHLQTVWHSFFPQIPFEYHFLDEEFEKLYQAEEKTSLILNAFAIITIFISCLGLLGLSAFTAEQRTREIGIRKVLGASVNSIVQLISKDFIKLVIVAIIIAAPLARWAMNNWLHQFAYRIEISWWMFIEAGLAALLIAILTISFQAIKAAIANPIASLNSGE